MTSASELFYSRRSRQSSRSIVDLELGFEFPGERSPHFSHHHRRQNQSRNSHRHDSDACDPLRRSPHLRHHRSSHSERPSLSSDQGNWQLPLSNTTTMEPQRNTRRPGFSASERLPGSVLLARERLLERLRGVSLSGSRQNSREISRMTQNEILLHDHWRLADASDWEAAVSIQTPSAGSHLNHSTLLSEQTASTSMKKPPGLSQHALDQLHVEVFIDSEKGRESLDCSICLDNFLKGDKLICLPCKHTFHTHCLDPWVRTCGDCPYCRKVIILPANQN
ncbi:hypothetical protein SAY87_018758 [Trapa incisa]|uniref:RING-type domain-containing protein n=2 Tax=Trapa TaxID=22665 RepID=A0AAN7M6D2_TRANT|nr:hypothetical protein SAY87_018758 [Trapa incisa]KAK4792637.1 hypothetical protein SAY86_023072 [Trapa natans]